MNTRDPARPRPNLFVIGAMKSGTTSLHNYLSDHPGIFMSALKEPRFFVDPARSERGNQLPVMTNQADYLDLFQSARGFPVVGESSAAYAERPGYHCDLTRLAAFSPRAKFIYIMRDPVERSISHYWHAARWQSEGRGLLQALQEEPHYRDVSHYALQLAPYFEAFGPDRVLTLVLEDMIAAPVQTMSAVFQWLGVDPAYRPSNPKARFNEKPAVVRRDRGLPGAARIRRTGLWRAVRPHSPPWFRAAMRNLSTEAVSLAPGERDAAVGFLRSIQQEQTKALSKLLRRDFPRWTSLYGDKR